MVLAHRDTNNIIHGPTSNIQPPKDGLGVYIYESCRKNADKLCQVLPEYNNASETYGSFLKRSIRVAIEMRKRGVKFGDVIVNCTKNTIDSALIPTAALFLGATSATIDPSQSARDAAHMLSIAQPNYIFVQANSIKLMEDALEIAKFNTEMIIFGANDKYVEFTEFLKESKDEDQFYPVRIEDSNTISFILFSSGTTGLPKGIELSHKSLYLGAATYLNSLFDTKCILHYTTFYWITALLTYVASFFNGSTRVADTFTTVENFYKVIETHQVTATFLATFYAHKFEGSEMLLNNYNISSLTTILFGGVPIDLNLTRYLRNLFPHTIIFSGYGMTEIGAFATGFNAEQYATFKHKINTCGIPSLNTQIKVVDTETNEILGPNKSGEICIKVKSIMNGYYNRKDINPFDSDGFFKSGDIGYYDDDNCFYIIDRLKDMFKYQCWHIVPKSIESVVTEHPDIDACVVFGIPDKVDGHLPAAAVTLKPNASITCADIIKFVDERVSNTQRLRGGVFIIDSFPRTPSGKISRQSIAKMILDNKN